MSDLEKILEEVAMEYWDQVSHGKETVLGVMRRRLLPLLEAGQAMRDFHDTMTLFVFKKVDDAWDAAKEKAKASK